MADFSDIPGELLNQRFQGLQDRYQGVQNMFSDPNAAVRSRFGLPNEGETDEEKRKRLAREAAAKSSPVKETRTTDPDTGEVNLKIEGREQDLSAANPNTPTVIAPKPVAAPQLGAGYAGSALTPQFNFQPPAQTSAPTQPVAPPMPQPMAQTQMPQPQVQQPRLQPVAAPAVPVAPTNQNLSGVQVGDISDSAPGTQVTLGNGSMGIVGANGTIQAAPSQTVTPVAPVAPTTPIQQMPGAPAANAAPVTQTATTANVVPEGGYASTLGSVQAQPYVEKFVNDQMNPARMAALAYDKTAPIEVQRAAAAQHLKQLQNEKGFRDAETFVAENAGNGTDFARMLAKEKGEGSYVKAYIFQRLGLTKLAQQEQEKLGAGNQWMSSLDGEGNRALLEFDANGLPKRGFNSEGRELNKKELAKFASNTMNLKGANVGASDYIDPVTKQTLQKVNTVNGPIYYDKSGNRVIPQGEPYALNTGSNLSVKELSAQIDTISALRKEFGTNALKAEDAFERKYGFFGSSGNPMTRDEFRTKYGIKEGMPGVKEVPTPPPPPVTGPGGVRQPINYNSTPVAPESGGFIKTAGPATETDQGGFIKTAGPATESAEQRANRQFNTPLDTATREGALQQRGGEQAIESAGSGTTVTAKSRAQRTETLPAREDDARRVIRTINEVIEHPGFEISTGLSAPIGSLMSIVPGTSFGTHARDWQAKYKELQGQNFLEAYANLRGTGGISEKEGSKAQQAVAALSDPGISEGEFKRNAELLKNDVKRRIDTERKALGMKPLDWARVETDMKKDALTEKDRSALDWAEKNPKDPRADKIRKELGF
jgi:hypothetical protein